MAKAASRTKSGPAPEDSLPSAEEVRQQAGRLRAFALDAGHREIVRYLSALAATPPQVILLEGGLVDDRLTAALYWTLLLNCPGGDASPCLECPECLRFLGRMHRDLFLLDGREESIKIDDVRAVREVLGEAPREARYRAVILAEAQSLSEAAANAMLKSLEEPRPHTVFVLLAPQRERLLPTLVSRSWVLTLPWHLDDAAADSPWQTTLELFFRTGCGLFDRTGARGSVDASVAHTILLLLQRALADALAHREGSALAAWFRALPPARLAMADAILAEGQESLQLTVNPTLVVEWMATHLYLLAPRPR